ncbi:hypothetical protein [Salmonella enterica]|uniref:hypothetical protein n=1 Tax=Salmonella enterica TaxID=28901 RepID=UPI00109D8DC9|nr:hypothetical protein [Salmonella enterica]QCC10074.1 hypothetical protein CVJ36_23400 [Salmonella enterica subsp. enterica serovar Oranienburg]
MGKNRKYKCKQCKQLEQKINEANQKEEIATTIAILLAFFILFGVTPVVDSIFGNANNKNTSALEEAKTIKNEKKIMELLDMKIQVCNKEDELQPGIYSFHLDSDTSCNTYKSEYRKLEEKYNTTKGNNNEINKDTK